MEQAIQVCGSILVLTAFVGAQRGRLTTDSTPYKWLNLIGAGVLAVLAAKERQPGFLLLEGVWALVAAWSLLQSSPAFRFLR
jgi:hypothetical protein